MNMRLCESAVLLLLVALTRAAPAPGSDPESEKCRELEVLQDKTKIFGRTYVLAAFTDNNYAWNSTQAGLISSIWSDVNQTQTGLSFTQFMKINGTCVGSRFNITISRDMIEVLMNYVMTENQFLNFSNTSMIMDLQITPENLKMILGQTDTGQDLVSHNLYLISREPELSETDLQRFRTHAECAGFTGEPVFILKSSQDYCTEEESAMIL